MATHALHPSTVHCDPTRCLHRINAADDCGLFLLAHKLVEMPDARRCTLQRGRSVDECCLGSHRLLLGTGDVRCTKARGFGIFLPATLGGADGRTS